MVSVAEKESDPANAYGCVTEKELTHVSFRYSLYPGGRANWSTYYIAPGFSIIDVSALANAFRRIARDESVAMEVITQMSRIDLMPASEEDREQRKVTPSFFRPSTATTTTSTMAVTTTASSATTTTARVEGEVNDSSSVIAPKTTSSTSAVTTTFRPPLTTPTTARIRMEVSDSKEIATTNTSYGV